MPNQNPEQIARIQIDAQLSAAGWTVQSIGDLNLHVSRGVAVREMQSHGGPADYILFVDGKALGIVEATVSTIQRLYSQLSGNATFDEEVDEHSGYEAAGATAGKDSQEVRYNPKITAAQRHRLDVIKNYIALNGAFATDDPSAYLDAWQSVDSDEVVPLAVARKAFGGDPKDIIEELNSILVA